MRTQLYISILLLGLIIACDPYVEEDIQLPGLPEAPNISLELDPNNANKVIIRDNSENDFFSRVWEAPGGLPNNSTLAVDTIFYSNAGTYEITLYAAASNGGGTSSITKTISIDQDAPVDCTDFLETLAGGCAETDIKCWKFSYAAGAISVGPVPGSSEWYTSPVDGLQNEQYDDRFCIRFTDFVYDYQNNGQTIDPWNGYIAVNYDPPPANWTLIEGGGENGENRLSLTEGAFIGVWDSGPNYDIATLTETTLVLRSEIVGADGWFELYFEAD